MAYLEYAKGVPQGLEMESQEVKLFVNECLNFDILEEKKISKTKNSIIKTSGRLKRGGGGDRHKPLPKYATDRAPQLYLVGGSNSLAPPLGHSTDL